MANRVYQNGLTDPAPKLGAVFFCPSAIYSMPVNSGPMTGAGGRLILPQKENPVMDENEMVLQMELQRLGELLSEDVTKVLIDIVEIDN